MHLNAQTRVDLVTKWIRELSIEEQHAAITTSLTLSQLLSLPPRERERPKTNELTHESKTDQHAWLPFCLHVVEISVTTSISIKIVCGRCANMYVCGCSVPMLGRGEGLPGVSKACLSKACLNLLGPAWKPVWPAWGLVWAAYRPVWLAGKSA